MTIFQISRRPAFATVLVMCFAFQSISAIEETLDDFRKEEEVAAKHPQPIRAKRSVKVNSSTHPNLPDIAKRLQALEKQIEALLKPKSSDSWLLGYLLGRDDRNDGKGLMGIPCPPGKPGTPGKPGQIGPKGESGKPGSSVSVPGPPGQKGDRRAVGRTGARGAKGEKGQTGKSGAKYVRWGKTTCPSGAEIVYKGIIGGEGYAHQGGGVNYLCLPHNPKYDKYKDGWQNTGRLFGTEYEVGGFNPFKKNLHNHEAPCAVCFVKSRGSMLMMPARNDCPSGWTEEYHGYLMTEYWNHPKQRDFICVDEDAEYVPGTQANKDGALLYLVEGRCTGSLPCKPYVAGREFTCTVCTK